MGRSSYMPQVVEPSVCFLRNGHLKRISQHAPQRLQSPRLSESAAIVSCLRKFALTKRRSFPCACRARNFASSTVRARSRSASRSSSNRCRWLRPLRNGFIMCRLLLSAGYRKTSSESQHNAHCVQVRIRSGAFGFSEINTQVARDGYY